MKCIFNSSNVDEYAASLCWNDDHKLGSPAVVLPDKAVPFRVHDHEA